MLKHVLSLRCALSALLLAAFAPGSTASAQHPRDHIVVDVPFSFQAGGRQFTPGHYDLTLPNPSSLSVASSDSFGQVMILWNQSMHPKDAQKVVFHRYGDQYFLRQVWLTDRLTYLSLPESKPERLLRMGMQKLATTAKPADGDVELAQAQPPK